jgi:exopolysaccharide production protein ExoQ
MGPSTAPFLFALGIAGLFFLDRDTSNRISTAVWLPVMWFCMAASRPLSAWLGTGTGPPEMQLLDGSPLDRTIFLILLVSGILVLYHRSHRTSVFSRASWPILIFFSYCLLSVLWSDFPDIAFRRWTKALGDLVMVLVVVTDNEPRAAVAKLLSRTGFILMPISVLLSRYFPNLGRTYDPFTGALMNVGVATSKNLLGVTSFVLSLGAVWRVLALLRDSRQPNRGRHLFAQGTLLAFGVWVLIMADSATSVVCFALGAGLLLATSLFVRKSRPVFVHALVFGALLAGALVMFLGGEADVIHALGRQTNLTGRLAIWESVIRMVPNPLLGAGFESFWLGSRLLQMWRAFPVFNPNEAHNGYIEVYLNLGWIGVALMALILINAYRRATAVFYRDPALGALMVAYVITAAFYSITEAGFRMLDSIWILLLLAIAATGEAARDAAEQPEPFDLPAEAAAVLPADESSESSVLSMLREEN